MQKDKNYFSAEKYEELKKELEELSTTRRREVAERLDSAKSLGDLSENAEYHAAREDQAELESRIQQLELMLKDSEIVKAKHGSVVEVGTTLTVRRHEGKEEKFTIVGSEEVDMANRRISFQSPLGASLLGKKEGSSVMVDTPRGKTEYTILSIN